MDGAINRWVRKDRNREGRVFLEHSTLFGILSFKGQLWLSNHLDVLHLPSLLISMVGEFHSSQVQYLVPASSLPILRFN